MTRVDAFAVEGCKGSRYVAEEMDEDGVIANLTEPADTSAQHGPKLRVEIDDVDSVGDQVTFGARPCRRCQPPARAGHAAAEAELVWAAIFTGRR